MSFIRYTFICNQLPGVAIDQKENFIQGLQLTESYSLPTWIGAGITNWLSWLPITWGVEHAIAARDSDTQHAVKAYSWTKDTAMVIRNDLRYV